MNKNTNNTPIDSWMGDTNGPDRTGPQQVIERIHFNNHNQHDNHKLNKTSEVNISQSKKYMNEKNLNQVNKSGVEHQSVKNLGHSMGV